MLGNKEIARLRSEVSYGVEAWRKELESKLAARGEVDRLRKQIGDEREKVEKLKEALEAALTSLTAVAGHIVQPMMAADARAKITTIKEVLADTEAKG